MPETQGVALVILQCRLFIHCHTCFADDSQIFKAISIGDDLHGRISIDLMRLTTLVMMWSPYVSADLQRSSREDYIS